MKILFNKIISIILLLIMCISILSPKVQAARTVTEIFGDAESFVSSDIKDDIKTKVTIQEDSIQALSRVVSGVLIVVGIVVAVIMIAIMGINFMIQSVEEKAKIKESLLPFLIGAIVTFGAFGIWRVTISLLSKV